MNQFELFVIFLLRGPQCSGCQETFQYCVTLSILGVRRASNTAWRLIFWVPGKFPVLRGPECSGCQESFQYCVTFNILGVRKLSSTAWRWIFRVSGQFPVLSGAEFLGVRRFSSSAWRWKFWVSGEEFPVALNKGAKCPWSWWLKMCWEYKKWCPYKSGSDDYRYNEFYFLFYRRRSRSLTALW
jgi:hypothetical protein